MAFNPLLGTLYLVRGFRLIAEPGMRRWVVIPMTINTLVFGVLIYLAYREFDQLVEHLNDTVPKWLQWLDWLLWPLFVVAIILLLFYLFTVIANLFAAPFNGLLAAAVERRLGHQAELPEKLQSASALTLALRSLRSELDKFSYQLRWTIPLLVLFLIPGVNLFAPILWTLFSCWMFTLEYCGYSMDNRGIIAREQRILLRRRPLLALVFGASGIFALLIPGFNLLVMPAAVAGATALWHEQFAER